MPSWWRHLPRLVCKNGKFPQPRLTRRSCGRPNYAPMVEEFEERLVPATLSIPTTGLTGARGSIVSIPINVDSLSGSDIFSGTTTGL
jgi:hypothetical protein